MEIKIYSIISFHIKQEKIMFIIIFLLIIQTIIKHKEFLKKENLELNNNYIKTKNDLNLFFNDKLNKKIRIGIYTTGLSGAGLQRSTSLIVNNFNQIKIFDIFYLLLINMKKMSTLFQKISKELLYNIII